MADFLKECLDQYPLLSGIAAVVLLIIHFTMPYHPKEHFPYDDPPPKLIASFSLGQLVQFVIQVVTFPVTLFAGAFVEFILGLPKETGTIVAFILMVLWWFIPKNLSRKLDGW